MSNLPLTNRIRRLLTLETKEDSAMKKALLLSLLLLVVPLASVRVRLVAEQPEVAKQPPTLVEPRPSLPTVGSPAAKEVASPYETPAAVRGAQLKMVETAKKAFLATNAAYLSGHTTLDPLVAWSTRWLAAELAVATTRDEQITAARANLERIQKIHGSIVSLYKTGNRGGELQQMETANYFLADAERRLAEIEARPETPVRSKTSILSPSPDPQAVRPMLILAGTYYDLDDPALMLALQVALKKRDDMPVLLEAIVATLSQRTDGSLVRKDYSSLAPELIELLDHPNAKVRDIAERSLLSMRSKIGPELEKGVKSQNKGIAMGAQRLLAQTEPTDVPSRPNSPFRLLSRERERAVFPQAPQPTGTTQNSLEVPTEAQARELRYEGKTFDQWVTELSTELSPVKRKDAMEAMGEFAVNGYGLQAATVIIDAMQGYSVWSYDNSPEGALKYAAIKSAMRVPAQQLAPVVAKALASGNKNQRVFALSVIPLGEETKEALIPLLVAALGDEDQQIVQLARPSLAVLDNDNPSLIASLRQALSAKPSNEVYNAVRIICGGAWMNSPDPNDPQIRTYVELVPEALALLNHQDEQIQQAAFKWLTTSTTPAYVEALDALISGNGPHAANARKVFDQIQSQQPLKIQSSQVLPPVR